MKNITYIFIFLIFLHVSSVMATVKEGMTQLNYCYSPYLLSQDVDLSLKFGEAVQKQKVSIKFELHIREVSISNSVSYKKKNSGIETKELRAFIFLVKADQGKVDNQQTAINATRYKHPFLVVIDARTGELLDLKSSTENKQLLKEYRSFYDYFQYTKDSGTYRYVNENGLYQATIHVQKPKFEKQKTVVLHKVNKGYVKGNNTLVIKDSLLEITIDETADNCFYSKATGKEHIINTFTPKTTITSQLKLLIKLDEKRKLPITDTFFTLGTNIDQWPSMDKVAIKLSLKEALKQLPGYISKLTAQVLNDKNFLDVLRSKSELWPFLAEYIREKGIDNATSRQLFWALDRIDSTASVATIVGLATSPLDERELFRAAVALGSTTAPLDNESMEKIQKHLLTADELQDKPTSYLAFVRMLGAVADGRQISAPLQNIKIKDFIYSQVNMHDDDVEAAIYDAIGNLGSSIDNKGRELLFNGFNEPSEKIKLAAVSAFKRIPYEKKYSSKFIQQFDQESNPQVKNTIIEIFSNTQRTDLVVKKHLMMSLNDQRYSKAALTSLKAINYNLAGNEIRKLENNLQRETNPSKQKLLAHLILNRQH